MMIIEKFDEATLAKRNQIDLKINQIAIDTDNGNCVALDDYEEAERQIDVLCDEFDQLKPCLSYTPERLSAHQVHAVEGTPWTYGGKPEPARTYSKEMSVSMYAIFAVLSPIAGIGLMFDNHVGVSICAFILMLFALLSLASESKTVMIPLHNRRIKRVNVDEIKKYELDGPTASHLRAELGRANWLRLTECLDRNDDQKLRRIVVNYFDDATEARGIRKRAQESTIVQELSDILVEELNTKIDTIVADAVSDIIDVFSHYDAVAIEEQRIAIERAEEKQIALEAVAEADEVSVNATIVGETARIVAKPRRYS